MSAHLMPLKNSWLFPVIQSIHLCGIALFVGTIILADLRLLGVALREHSAGEIARRLAPWTWTGLAIMLITGPVMFASDIPRYTRNPAFIFKMVVLLLALAFHFTIHRKAVAAGKGRLAAILSMLLWSCVVLGGRAIADFDI